MTSLAAKIIAGVVGILIIAGLVLFVAGIGPFHVGKSAAAKVQPKVEAAVTKTQTKEAAAITHVEAEAKTSNASTEKKAEKHVANIRAAAPPVRVAPGTPRPQYRDYPDGEFFAGVCDTLVYAGNPNCRGYRGEPEGHRPAAGPRAVRGR